MDPNENIKQQLICAQSILDAEHIEEYAEQLAELVLALDEWLEDGGFLPNKWEYAMQPQP